MHLEGHRYVSEPQPRRQLAVHVLQAVLRRSGHPEITRARSGNPTHQAVIEPLPRFEPQGRPDPSLGDVQTHQRLGAQDRRAEAPLPRVRDPSVAHSSSVVTRSMCAPSSDNRSWMRSYPRSI